MNGFRLMSILGILYFIRPLQYQVINDVFRIDPGQASPTAPVTPHADQFIGILGETVIMVVKTIFKPILLKRSEIMSPCDLGEIDQRAGVLKSFFS